MPQNSVIFSSTLIVVVVVCRYVVIVLIVVVYVVKLVVGAVVASFIVTLILGSVGVGIFSSSWLPMHPDKRMAKAITKTSLIIINSEWRVKRAPVSHSATEVSQKHNFRFTLDDIKVNQMNGKTKILAWGIIALMIFVGAASASADYMRGKQGKGHRGMDPGMGGNIADVIADLGLPEDATREDVREAMWAKKLADLGLTEDSTVGEFHVAMKAKNQEWRADMLAKLGLAEDAQPEDVRAAMKAYCVENPDDCPKKGRGPNGHGPKGGFAGKGNCPFSGVST